MTAQDLKNAILQLAVQGKLVPQDPNDEPVAVLLKRIRAEKERLVKEGKIKKEKPLPPITEEEMPFEIPENWAGVRIGDIWSVINGDRGQNYPAKSTLSHAGIPFISALNLNGKTVINDDNLLCLSETQYQKLGSGKLVQGDIVVCIRGSLGKHGRYPFEKGAIASSLVILRSSLNATVLDDFLMLYLDAPLFFCEIKRFDNGTAQPNLAAKSLEKFLIPLPPLAEQQRIVAKIEEMIPLVEEYGKAEERLTALNAEFPDKLRKSILQQAIQGKLTECDPADEPASELLKRIRAERQQMQKDKKAKKSQATETIDEDELTFDLPENWSWAKLGWLCQKVGAGSTPTGGAAVYVPHGIKFLREQNVHDDGLHLEGVAFIDEKTNNQKAGSIVQAQDILMNITGGSIGRNALVPDDFDIANVNQHVLIIRLVEKPLRHYLHLCLCAPFVLNQMFSKQIGDKPGLSATKVENFVIPLPPLAEQQRIVDRVNELLAVCDELN